MIPGTMHRTQNTGLRIFGNNMIDLETNPISVEDSATMEALSYSVEFDDWKPIDFECFPGIEGVAWKTHFGGMRKKHRSDRILKMR